METTNLFATGCDGGRRDARRPCIPDGQALAAERPHRPAAVLAYSVGLYLFFMLVAFVLGLIAGFTRSSPMLATLVGLAIYFVGSALLLIQRSHDMNISGWWSFAAFIPFVGLFWLFNGGTLGPNRWGAPPPPNTMGVKIIALFFPILAIIGIVAAVALPAYQQYTVRAKAAANH